MLQEMKKILVINLLLVADSSERKVIQTKKNTRDREQSFFTLIHF